MLLPRGVFWTVTRAWAASSLHIARVVLGIRYDLRGLENLPPGAALLASKHQSAFDTLVFNVVLPDEIGRASCRAQVCQYVKITECAVPFTQKHKTIT